MDPSFEDDYQHKPCVLTTGRLIEKANTTPIHILELVQLLLF